MYENVRSFALNILCAWFIHEMKKGTILVKFKTLTQATNITFFFPTHTYRAIQNNLNNCVNFSSAWVWITPHYAMLPKRLRYYPKLCDIALKLCDITPNYAILPIFMRYYPKLCNITHIYAILPQITRISFQILSNS